MYAHFSGPIVEKMGACLSSAGAAAGPTSDTVHQGYLFIAPPGKRVNDTAAYQWVRRWFVLNGSTRQLAFYAGPNLKSCKGAINLQRWVGPVHVA